MAKISINGFGRIGRAFLKLAIEKPELEIVAINDLGDLEALAYLLRFDSVYGKYDKEVTTLEEGENKFLIVGPPSHKASEGSAKKILFLAEKDPLKLPWANLGIDIVVEATGAFESYEKASVHKQTGAKRVVLTAPAKDEDTDDAKTVLLGINEEEFKSCTMTSNASCTTNSAAPVMQILLEKIGVKKAFLSTAHAMTATQMLIDGPTFAKASAGKPAKESDLRRGRSAAINITPSTTGAAIAVTRAVRQLAGKFDGVSLRVPVIDGSISVITFISERTTSVEEINDILMEAEKDPRWQGILKTTTDQIVSTDIIGEAHAAVVDLSLTKVVDGDLCTVFSWYDNEFGYTNTLVEHVIKIAKLI